MSKIEDGGAAFARPGFYHADGKSEYDCRPEDGMSLRDWFAGHAISSIIDRCGADPRPQHEALTDYFARKAYDIADAMLIARQRGRS